MFLVIVRLQDVAVLGHHEDGDEVDHGKSQELSLLTVLLKQTTRTKQSVRAGRRRSTHARMLCFHHDLQYLGTQQP